MKRLLPNYRHQEAVKKLEYNYLAPDYIADLSYKVFTGPADLDPCAHPQQLVKAAHYCYGGPGDDDGMSVDWTGLRVWLNPVHRETRPRDKDTKLPIPLNFEWHPLSQWIAKACLAAQQGGSVLALMPAATDNKTWFHRYIPTAAAWVLLKQRVRSLVPGDVVSLTDEGCPTKKDSPNRGHMLALWTANAEVYDNLGRASEDIGLFIAQNPPDGSLY